MTEKAHEYLMKNHRPLINKFYDGTIDKHILRITEIIHPPVLLEYLQMSDASQLELYKISL